MKENLISDKSLIYQWTFNDNMSIVDNPRVKATVYGNPTYNNGVATFNGSTDYYKLKTLINLGIKYSIEIKFKLNSIPSYNARLLGMDGSNYLRIGNTNIIEYGYGSGYNSIPFTRDLNWHTLTIARSGSNGQMHLDGIQKTTFPASFNATAIGLISTICADDLGNVKLPCSLEYIKVWNRQLTASEVKNNYTGKTYRSLPYKSTTLFHINSDNGVIRDLTGKTTPADTNVQLPKIGSNVNVIKFDGGSGNINLGSQSLVGDITFMGWVNNTDRGELLDSRIIDNSKLYLRHSSSPNKLFVFTRNNSTTISASAINAFKESLNIFICITSTSTGITNFYIGDKNNPPTLSGTANQSAGTPIAGSNCYLGNRASDDRTLNGWLNDIIGIQAVITQEEMMQTWSSTKYKYQ